MKVRFYRQVLHICGEFAANKISFDEFTFELRFILAQVSEFKSQQN